jgi:hypothetical protein
MPLASTLGARPPDTRSAMAIDRAGPSQRFAVACDQPRLSWLRESRIQTRGLLRKGMSVPRGTRRKAFTPQIGACGAVFQCEHQMESLACLIAARIEDHLSKSHASPAAILVDLIGGIKKPSL